MHPIVEFGRSRLSPKTKRFLKRVWRRLPGTPPEMLIIEHMEVDFVFSQLFEKKRLRILDIGSHHGEMLEIFERHTHPHTYEVWCVEPFPDNAREIRRRAKRMKRVDATVCEAAISEVSGPRTLFVGSADTLITCSETHVRRFEKEFQSRRTLQVQAYTIEDLFRQFGIPRTPGFDFVKIDVEGYDLQVVRSLVESGVESHAVMFEMAEDPEEVDAAVQTLTAAGYRECFVFGRKGIPTTYIGEYQGRSSLVSLLKNDRLSVGNVVAIKSRT
jgi:FkbM family methyltransferase